MNTLASKIGVPDLRVLLVGAVGQGSEALAVWLADQAGLEIFGPALTTADALALAARIRPHVVLLDFQGLPVSTGYAVSLFNELSPAPKVFVLTHDGSDATRRRCRDAGVDAVFDKTTELDAVTARLRQLKNALPATRESSC